MAKKKSANQRDAELLTGTLNSRPGGAVVSSSSVVKELEDLLGPVRYVNPKVLSPHPDNPFVGNDIEQVLADDIEKNGIHDPLVSLPDDTIMAGHTRYRIAIDLELKKVPVRYLQRELSKEEQLSFIYRDNLYRRQLDSSQWLDFYMKIEPELAVALERENRGRAKKKDTVLFKDKTKNLSQITAELAAKTGDNPATIAKRIQRGNKKETAIINPIPEKNRAKVKELNRVISQTDKEIVKLNNQIKKLKEKQKKAKSQIRKLSKK